MKTSIAVATAVLVLALVFTGCATVQVGTTFNGQQITEGNATPVAHVNGKVWGIYLLNIPIISGDPETGAPAMFTDTVNADTVAGMVTAKSKELGGTKTTSLVSGRTSVWIAPFLVFFYESVEASGNATR